MMVLLSLFTITVDLLLFSVFPFFSAFHQISEISEYDPLDLFSGSKDEVQKSIRALYRAPQNNFRVFLNGSLIFGDLDGGEITNNLVGQDFEGALKYLIEAEDEMHKELFFELIAEALLRSGSLELLLDAQKLDSIDIEGAIHAYYDVVSQPCILCRNVNENKISNRYTNLHSQSLDENLKIVRDYLIASTAKDLSMMLSFRPRKQWDVVSSYDVLFLKSANQTFDYKVHVLSLCCHSNC